MRYTFRASEIDRVLSCNGSITLVPRVAKRKGREAFEGIMAHWMIAVRAIRELGATPPEGGLPPPEVPAGYVLSKAIAWVVDWAIRHIIETIPPDWSLMVEVAMEDNHERWDNTGHSDLVAISPDGTESIGIDWKIVRIPVDPADENWQILDYVCLKKATWPTLRKCTFQVAQPLVTEDDDVERVSTLVMEGERLEAARGALDVAVCKAIDNRMELNSSKKACAWCPVSVQCKALRLTLDLMKVTLTPEDVARVKREPDDATLGDWVVDARTLARPTKDAETLLKDRIEATGYVDAGCGSRITMTTQKGSYSVPDPLKFMQAVRVLLPKDESIAAVMTPSMSRIKDEVAKEMNVPKTGKAAVTAESIFDGHLRPLVEQGERKLLQFSP